MLETLNDNTVSSTAQVLNFNNYKIKRAGEVLKKLIIVLLLIITTSIIADTYESEINKKINNIMTLRVMNVTPDDIWEDLGINEDTNFYFNGNLYECIRGEISSETCNRITINYEFPYKIKAKAEIQGYSYIFNDNEEITKENSIIIAKNYIIDEYYSLNEYGEIIDNDCVIDNSNTCIIPKEEINNIVDNMMLLYYNWKSKEDFNINYDKLIENIDRTSGELNLGYNTIGTKFIPYFKYDAIRLIITSKILNNLNIYKSNYYEFYNLNNSKETNLMCELYKVQGYDGSKCDFTDIFPDVNNILGVEKRVFYSKKERKENTNLYFDGFMIREKLTEENNENEGDLQANIPSEFPSELLVAQLTGDWSADLIVNTYILRSAALKESIYTAESSNNRLWILTSEIMNKTFEFYENKIKAKAKIKQLMQLKSIGLLGTQNWRDLGFQTYENDIKSEIKVSELLETYDNIKFQYSSYFRSNNSKKIFDEAGLNSLFLAKLLKKLDLQMVNGKILDKYNTIYIQKLLSIGEEGLEDYKEELLIKKDEIIKKLSNNRTEFLKKFFRMATTLKLLEAIKTNGFNKTIPDFRLWLKAQSNGLLKVFYQDFSDKYLALIDKILSSVPEKLMADLEKKDDNKTKMTKEEREKYFTELEKTVAPIRQILSDEYFILYYELTDDYGLYEGAYRTYNDLEIIDIIARESINKGVFPGVTVTDKNIRRAQAIIDLKEIDAIDFKNLVLNTPNLLYPDEKTNLYYLFNIYRENDIGSVEAELENLIADTIITTKIKVVNSNYSISNPNYEDVRKYSELGYYLSDALINDHHFKYEIVGEIIKNISFSEESGVNYERWVDVANENDIDGYDIWSILGVDNNSSLAIGTSKNINLDEVIEQYKKLSDVVKKSLGLEVNLYSKNYDASSMFFDPITTMLLSKILIDKGYYISTDIDGYNDIFNSSGENKLHLEIKGLIEEIRSKHDLFNDNFRNLYNHSTLGEYLNNIRNPENTDLSQMMSFINFSYTKDLKTGQRNINFDFGIANLNDDVIWNRITSSIDNRTSGNSKDNSDKSWGQVLHDRARAGVTFYVNGATFGVFEKELSPYKEYMEILGVEYETKKMQEEVAIKIRFRLRPTEDAFKKEFDGLVKDELEGNYKGDTIGAMKSVLGTYELAAGGMLRLAESASINYLKAKAEAGKRNDELKKLEKEEGNLSLALTQAEEERETAEAYARLYPQDGRTQDDLEKAKLKVDNLKKDINKNKNNLKTKTLEVSNANKEASGKKETLDKAKLNHEKAKAKVDKTKEEIKKEEESNDNEMCRAETYSEACDSGVSPAGIANILARTPQVLLSEIDKKIRNIPPRECNIITRSCDGNSIEISTEEMKTMTDRISAEQNADDGGCIWSPMGECSVFGENQSGWSYIDLLWDPIPMLVE